MNDFVEIKNLNYYNLFQNFNFSISKNQFITISGTNKCGKTTLIKILSREIKTNNCVIINGEYIEDVSLNSIYKKIGVVIPQDNNLFLFDSVEQELMFLLDQAKLEAEQKSHRFKQIVKIFKLNKYLSLNPNELYKNLKIKINLAKATILKPELLLLDDICSRMTKNEAKEILDILNYFKDKEQMTIIMATDNLTETIESDYLYILSSGKIVLQGKPLEVLKNDNILNKLGLNLPFMVDLSVKLRDYDLVNHIELDMDRMVNELWK